MISYLEMENSTFQPIILLCSNLGLECNPKSRKSSPRTTRPRSQSRPLAQCPNGYPNIISYLETENRSFQLIIPLRSNLGLYCDPKSRTSGPRTTHPRSQSIPHAQSPNGYPNMISYLETENSSFQPIIPLRSNLGLEYDPKSRKSRPRTTCPRSQSIPHAQLPNGYPNMISYLETKNSAFKPIIPLHSNLGLECDLKSRKSDPITTRPHSQSRPLAQLPNGYPNMISYLEMENSAFQPIIPLCSKLCLECDPKSRKSSPKTTRTHSQSIPHEKLTNGYPNMISYLEMENCAFQPIMPLHSNLGLECDSKSRKSGPRTTHPRSQSTQRAQLPNGYPNMISYLETENCDFQPIIPLCSNLGLECDPKSRKRDPRTTRPHSQSKPCAQLPNGYPNMISYLETENCAFQPIIPLRSNMGLECYPKSRKTTQDLHVLAHNQDHLHNS
jgi:hypothetical protein